MLTWYLLYNRLDLFLAEYTRRNGFPSTFLGKVAVRQCILLPLVMILFGTSWTAVWLLNPLVCRCILIVHLEWRLAQAFQKWCFSWCRVQKHSLNTIRLLLQSFRVLWACIVQVINCYDQSGYIYIYIYRYRYRNRYRYKLFADFVGN